VANNTHAFWEWRGDYNYQMKIGDTATITNPWTPPIVKTNPPTNKSS
jgi:hypothetical protein